MEGDASADNDPVRDPTAPLLARANTDTLESFVAFCAERYRLEFLAMSAPDPRADLPRAEPDPVPTLPPILHALAGLSGNTSFGEEGGRAAFETLLERLRQPLALNTDDPTPMLSLLLPEGRALVNTLLAAPAEPEVSASGSHDMMRMMVEQTALFETLCTAYGRPALAERVQLTVDTLKVAASWVRDLARALVAAGNQLQAAAAIPDVGEAVGKAALEARIVELEQKLAEAGDYKSQNQELRRRIAAYEKNTQELRAQVADSVGDCESVVRFFSKNCDFPNVDPAVLRYLLTACKTFAKVDSEDFLVVARVGHGRSVPGLPAGPAPVTSSSVRFSMPEGESTVAAEKAHARAFADRKVQEARAHANARPRGAKAGETVDLTERGVDEGDSDDSNEPMPEEEEEEEDEDEDDAFMGYGGGGESEEEDDDSTKIQVPRFSIPAEDVDTSPTETSGRGQPKGKPDDDGEHKKRKSAPSPAEVVRPKAQKKKRANPQLSGISVPLVTREPTYSLLATPMPLVHPGVSYSTMPKIPEPVADLPVRYTWLRATASYVCDLPTMASAVLDQLPDSSPDEWCPDAGDLEIPILELRRFSLLKSQLTLPVGTVMGVNAVLQWSPSFTKELDRPMRAHLNGIPVQRDTVKKATAKVSKAEISPFYPAYGVSKTSSAAVIASYDAGFLDDYFAFLETRPWDEMFQQRVRILYVMDPTTLNHECQRWLRRYFQFMFHQRQAFWEHYHWLHTGTKTSRQAVEWRVLIERRGFLAKHLLRAWSILLHLRPRSFPRDYVELLISEPAFWYRPPLHCTWVPSMTKLRADPPTTLAAQVAELDHEEPIRVQYAGYESRVVESLKARAQVAMRYHHYIGAMWAVPLPWQDAAYPLADPEAVSLGTPGPQFYRVDYDETHLEHWKKKTAMVASRVNLLSGFFGDETGDDVLAALFTHWDPDKPLSSPPGSPSGSPPTGGRPPPIDDLSSETKSNDDEDPAWKAGDE
jgi:hypothetical protein